MNESIQERSHIHASIVIWSLAGHHTASNMNELTQEWSCTCKHCNKCFSDSSNCKRHETPHTGVKPYTCTHCKKCFSQIGDCKRHERVHTGEKRYSCKHRKKCFCGLSNCKGHEQHAQYLKQTRHLQKPTTTHGSKTSRVLFSSTEENSRQVESLTCWICQEELSSHACLIQHYDDHMRQNWMTLMQTLLFALS